MRRTQTDTSDPDQLRDAALKEREERAKFQDALRHVAATPQGKRVLWWILDLAGVYRTSFTGNSETFFREGARNLGLQVIEELEQAAPDALLAMIDPRLRET